jgi:hypothetical protein
MVTGLPVLRDSASMKSSALASMAAANRSRARLRSAGVALRQVSNASAAVCSAASTSAAPDTGASRYASPVLGSTTALVRPSLAGTCLPPTKLLSTVSPAAAMALLLTPHMPRDMPRCQRTAPTLTEKR